MSELPARARVASELPARPRTRRTHARPCPCAVRVRSPCRPPPSRVARTHRPHPLAPRPETITATLPPLAVVGRQPVVCPTRIHIAPEPGHATLGGGIFDNNTEPALQVAALEPPIAVHNASARLGGSLAEAPTAAAVRAGGATLEITLHEARFRADGVAAVLAALGHAAPVWAAAVRPQLGFELAPHLVNLTAERTRLTLRLPPSAGYALTSPEVVHALLPGEALESGVPIEATPPLRITATPATLAVDAAFDPAIDGAPPYALVLRLVGAGGSGSGWSAGVEGDAELRRAVVRGFQSRGGAPSGWHAVVEPALLASLAAPSAPPWPLEGQRLTIPLPAGLGGYAVRAPETVAVRLPAAALGGRATLAPPEFVIPAAPASAVELRARRGGATAAWLAPGAALSAADVRDPAGIVLRIRLVGDEFDEAVGVAEADGASNATLDVLAGLHAPADGGGGGAGWAAAVAPFLRPAHVARLDERTVELTVPPVPAYELPAGGGETLILTLPPSQTGVKIDLVVRGMCCLRPGIAGVSHNIQVRSIIGRFLEHTRVFYFLNGGDEKIYLSSADWMERNLDKRVETCFPVEGKKLIMRVKKELESCLTDNTQAWVLQADGRYQRLQPTGNQNPRNAQAGLLEKLTAPVVVAR